LNATQYARSNALSSTPLTASFCFLKAFSLFEASLAFSRPYVKLPLALQTALY
jgi:hypothetical protein